MRDLIEMKREAEGFASEVNKLNRTGGAAVDVEKMRAALAESIKDYNDESKMQVFITLRESEAPMKAAIVRLTYPTIKVKAKKDKDSDLETVSVEDGDAQISLIEFYDQASEKVENLTPDWRWKSMAEKYNLLLAYKTVKDLQRKLDGKKKDDETAKKIAKKNNDDVKRLEKKFYIQKVARDIDMGKTPTSNTQIMKGLQDIVNAIIFEDNGKGGNIYKVQKRDIIYILDLRNSRRTSGCVSLPKFETFATLLMDILHRIVTDSDFTFAYRTGK